MLPVTPVLLLSPPLTPFSINLVAVFFNSNLADQYPFLQVKITPVAATLFKESYLATPIATTPAILDVQANFLLFVNVTQLICYIVLKRGVRSLLFYPP
jgi:hypothetical protein